MLRWALGIPPEHSDFECSVGHLAFHRSIQISNAQMGIGYSNGIFRRALDIPPRMPNKGGMPNAHQSIRNLNVPVECPMPIWALKIRMSRWNANAHLSIWNLNAPVECPLPIWAFKIWMPRWNTLCLSDYSKCEYSAGMPKARLSIRNLNAP